MKEFGTKHDLSYRQEILEPLFKYIQGAESFFVVGGASVGKTRLMDFIFREDVQKQYLRDQEQPTWLIRIDLNRHHAKEDWHFYELLISSMMLSCSQYENTTHLFEQLVDLDRQVIESRDYLRALRFFELAVHMLCKNQNLNVCFLFDEFDKMYKTMEQEIFDQLRAVRDANKNQLCYGLFLRNLPETLRDMSDNESFYELLSHRMIGLGPYTHDDGINVIQQIEVRKQYPLSQRAREIFYQASGGHPGLINALFNHQINKESGLEQIEDPSWVINQGIIKEECTKVFNSLSEDEQHGLLAFIQENPLHPQTLKLLKAKGFLRKNGGAYEIFSPIFRLYLKEKTY